MFIRGELPDHAAIFTVSPLTERPGPSDAATLYVNSADFNGDGDGNVGTDSDIAPVFACLWGDCCPTCGSADFNADGNLGTDADIESFFRFLAGGSC